MADQPSAATKDQTNHIGQDISSKTIGKSGLATILSTVTIRFIQYAKENFKKEKKYISYCGNFLGLKSF